MADISAASMAIAPPPDAQISRTPFFRVLMLVFGGSIAVQALAFVRQIVIAAAFGVDRAMDLYVMVFAVATIAAFALSAIIENAAVPMLVGRIEARDRDGFRTVATRVLVLGLGVGLLCCAAFAVGVPIFAYGVAWGLGAADKWRMLEIAPWFLGWVFLAAPFYAAGSVLKAEQRFPRFFLAEITVTVVSTAVLLAWRPHVGAIAAAYGAGYAAGLLTMLPAIPLNLRGGAWRRSQSLGIRRQLSRLFLANQVGSLTVAVDRFLQSFLPAGAISAASYATLISTQVGGLLTFRDAFMAPLSRADGKTEKLERILIGLALLAIPASVFIAAHAQMVVSVLLERGRFDRAASELAGTILQVQALSVAPSTLLLPMFRLLQILDRMRYTAYLLLFAVALLLGAGLLLIFGLRLGILGYAGALVTAAVGTMMFAAYLVARAGVRPDWLRIGRYALYAAAASLTAAGLARVLPGFGHRIADLALAACAFGFVIAAAYGAIHRRLRAIAHDMG
jgi:putative peptidoglycan lipid II flippase